MTASEQAAFAAGIKYAISMAQIAAVTIELRPDARDLRQQAAVAALYGLVAGLKESLSTAPAITVSATVTSETIADAIYAHAPSNPRPEP